MSIISNRVEVAARAAEKQLGDTFDIIGVGKFFGVYSEQDQEVSDEDVGSRIERRISIVATKGQFENPPEFGQFVLCGEGRFLVREVIPDSLHYKIELERK